MSILALYLFGPPRLELDGAPVHFPRRKAMALLAYLAVTGQNHSRDALAAMLWPESDQSSARGGLRRMLSEINKVLGEGRLEADWETVRLNIYNQPASKGTLRLDVAAFQEKMKVGENHNHPTTTACPDCLPDLEGAVKLYSDDFMIGFSLKDCPAFDEWQFFKSDELRAQLAGTLERLSSYHATLGENETAIAHSKRWLALDPLDEQAHRQLMRIYDQAGQRSLALRQYENCWQALEEELGAEPSLETKELLKNIQASTLAMAMDMVPKSNLPAQATPFIGRDPELAEIRAKLKDDDCRLLTLLGPGGSGKTRLAVEAAEALLDDYQHGVFFVDLAPLQSADLIPSTIASAIRFTFYEGGSTPEEQLLDHLQPKEMLLILDNFEHLLDGVSFVNQILKTTPDVKMLATSRIRLMVSSENVFEVWGMAYPEVPVSLEIASDQYSAIKLFEAESSRVLRNFKLSDENLSDVIEICSLLEGIPLGIVLAASWVDLLTPKEIGKEIVQNLAFLETELVDIPRRQKSLRSVFHHSWQLLSESEREVMHALSVFRGGFTREMAQTIASASIHDLVRLTRKSMLRRTSTGRYEIHELLRQYAAEKLTSNPAMERDIRGKHSETYCQMLAVWERDLQGPQQAEASQEMTVEIDNIRSAWNWAVENTRVRLLLGAINGLCIFDFEYRQGVEGEVICRYLIENLDALRVSDKSKPDSLNQGSAIHIDILKLKARVLAWGGLFNSILENLDRSHNLTQKCLSTLESDELAGQDTRFEEGLAYLILYWITRNVPRRETKPLAEKALRLFKSLDETWWMCSTLISLGNLATSISEEKYYYEQALAVYRKSGDLRGLADTLDLLSFSFAGKVQFEKAEAMLYEAMAIHKELNDRLKIARIYGALGLLQIFQGRFEESRLLIREILAIYQNLDYTALEAAWLHVHACYSELYLGAYEAARNQAQHTIELFSDVKSIFATKGIAAASEILGRIVLAKGAYAESQEWFLESIPVYQDLGPRDTLAQALACQGFAARGLNLTLQAQEYFMDALRVAIKGEDFFPLIHALPGIALLFADQGDIERAVELYALASSFGVVANSKWFADIAGDEIASAAEELPVKIFEAAKTRGRELDLWERAAGLLEEFEPE
jgi:predicted ATPase/DNA-binding SARP family transcriptional activator